MEPSDDQLLAAYRHERDQAAFAALVRRRAPLVYAAARRQVDDPNDADDVTQAAFVLLARRADAVPRGAVAGWLLASVRLIARGLARAAARRRRHEAAAAAGRFAMTSDRATTVTGDDHDALDRALARLSDRDRTAVAVRYLEQRSLSETAAALGISTAAAEKRLTRALARLRRAWPAATPALLAAGGPGTVPRPLLQRLDDLSSADVGGRPATLALEASKLMARRTLLGWSVASVAAASVAAAVSAVAVHVLAAPPEPPAPATVPVLPHDVPFALAESTFPADAADAVTITAVRGDRPTLEAGGRYEVQGTYRLRSRDRATLLCSVTRSAADPAEAARRTVPEPDEYTTVGRGEGEFRLALRMVEGRPHVSLYPQPEGSSLGGVYLGPPRPPQAGR